MCTKILSCILCGQPNFPSVDALRVSLLKVTARPLKCPICGDELLGLDKLTIHLFGHSLLEEHPPSGPSGSEPVPEATVKSESKRNPCEGAGGVLQAVRKVRRREPSVEAEVKRSEHGTDIGWVKMSPASERPPSSSATSYCAECAVEFRDPVLLKMHREVFHDTGGLRDTDKRFVCHICPKEFKMKGSLKIHMRVVHGDSHKKLCLAGANRPGVAQAASISTPLQPDIVLHSNEVTGIHQHHNHHLNDHLLGPKMSMQMLDQNIAVFQPPPVDGVAGAPHPEPQIIQIIDPRQLAQVVYLPPSSSSGPAAAQPFTQEPSVGSPRRMESPSLPASPQQAPGQADNPKQWECDVCRKSFTTKYFLKKHNRLHTGEMPYTCGICSKSFTFQQSYHKHLLYHSDEKPHVCTVCNRAFKELSTLHNHERIHSGEKPFACETCGKCFRQRVSYLVHRRIHTGLMPYKCSGCEKSFRYKVSQRTHKCPASPPGTVVRKTGDLLQKLLQSSAILPEGSSQQQQQHAHQQQQQEEAGPGPVLFSIAPTIGDDSKRTADYVNRTLDELVQGTYHKLGNTGGPCPAAGTLYDHQPQLQQLYPGSPGSEPQFKQTHTLQGIQPIAPAPTMDGAFPRIENLCLLSPSAFDGGQLEDLEGLKLDNGW